MYVHERNSLATAISQYFESKNDGAPEGWAARAIPSVEGIRGSLQACEDQTSAFCWDKLLSAVAATLGMDEEFPAIPTPIFHGLISMLPLVQHLPQDRMIVVEMTEGVCAIVVWAHLLLGLTVRVSFLRDNVPVSEHFGDGPEQLFVQARYDDREPYITLFSTSSSTKESLFTLKAEADGDRIDAAFKRPLRGFAKRLFNKHTPHQKGREKVIEELTLIACSFAMCIVDHLHVATSSVALREGLSSAVLGAEDFVDDWNQPQPGDADYSDQASERDSDEDTDPIMYKVSKERVLSAARMLFEDRRIK